MGVKTDTSPIRGKGLVINNPQPIEKKKLTPFSAPGVSDPGKG